MKESTNTTQVKNKMKIDVKLNEINYRTITLINSKNRQIKSEKKLKSEQNKLNRKNWTVNWCEIELNRQIGEIKKSITSTTAAGCVNSRKLYVWPLPLPPAPLLGLAGAGVANGPYGLLLLPPPLPAVFACWRVSAACFRGSSSSCSGGWPLFGDVVLELEMFVVVVDLPSSLSDD